jgi:glycosyltransferase involved in cell wall biosynthesis
MADVMNPNPLVSIIVIFLNEERFIEEAIQSVFAQTYENWELLLVDDGSTDGSSEIARTYAKQQQSRVRYLEHPQHQNHGMSESRNRGIRDAKGEYITFLDADDVWLPGKLQRQTAILAAHSEVGLICSPAQWWYGWTGRPDDIERDFTQQLDVALDNVVRAPELLLLYLQNEWASICDLLVRRKIVEAVGGYEPTFRDMYEDQVFHAKLCLRSAAFVTSECWYRYRQHPNACTVSFHRAGQYRSARRIFLNWLKEYLHKQGENNIAVRKVLRRELWSLRYPRLSRIAARGRSL